jgi:putative transport protein
VTTSTRFQPVDRLFGCCRGLAAVLVAAACWTAVAATAAAQADGGPGVQAEPGAWEIVRAALSEPLVLCFLIIAVGMGLGSIRIGGLSLGTSGVLFAGLLFGHLAAQEQWFGEGTSWELPSEVGTLGLVLFVYAVGLGAGPTFFRTFRHQGKQLAFLGIVTVVTGAVTITVLAWLFEIPGELAAGIFSGSLTSTPALAAGIEAAREGGQDPLAVSIGYGMVYPVGVIAVVVFVQLVPRLLRVNVERVGQEAQARVRSRNRIDRYLVKITNPAVFGKQLREIKLLGQLSGQITRVLEGDRLVPIKPDHVLAQGQIVLLVTDETTAEVVSMLLGERTEARVVIDSDRDRALVVVTSPEMLNRPLRELHLRTRFGVTVARVERYGVDMVPNANTCFSMADRATVVGEPESLQAFTKAAGHRVRKLHETDLMSAGIGLVVGILLGMIPIRIPGLGEFTLGMAGGPLIAGLLFAHFGRLMGILGYMPLAARMLTQELGLAFFLASAGFSAGGHFVEMLHQYGARPFLIGAAVALLPMMVAFGFARYLLRMDLLQSLGGICGSMTSTAGIGAIVSKTDCDIPVSSYAAAYPAALVMMTILAQLIVNLMR